MVKHCGPEDFATLHLQHILARVLLVANRLRLQGFLVSDHTDLRPEFLETVSGWLGSGELVVRETVREGLEDAVPAFLDLLRGGNTGKMVVRLSPDAD